MLVVNEHISELSDHEFLVMLYKGNTDAVELVMDVVRIADIWDNMIDRDKEVTDDDIYDVFWRALVKLPRNPLYQELMVDIATVFATAIMNWRVANTLERGGKESIYIAHTLRYSITDIATYLAIVIGGPDWAAKHGAEIRMRSQRDTLGNYLKELGHEDEAPTI